MTTAAAPVAESATTTPPEPPTELSSEELLKIENARLRRELGAMVDQRKRAAELVEEVDREDTRYESSKAEAKKAKDAREVAKASLRALIKGDAQATVDFDAKDDGKQQPGPTGPARKHDEVGTDHRAVAGSYGIWQFGLTREALAKVDVGALQQLEPEVSKRKIDAVEILGDKPYVPLETRCYDDGSGYFVLWPLLDTDAWDATCAEKYAHAVRDLGDEAPDITARRKTGGKFCGVTVKRGRRKFVVGPDDQAVRVVYAPDGVKGPDGGYLAAKLLAAEPSKHADVLSFPASQLPDRMEARLREYEPLKATGYHEAMVEALATDLKVDAGDIVKAAKADAFRFEIFLGAVGSQAAEIVRLLVKDTGDGAAEAPFGEDDGEDDEAGDEEDEG